MQHPAEGQAAGAEQPVAAQERLAERDRQRLAERAAGLQDKPVRHNPTSVPVNKAPAGAVYNRRLISVSAAAPGRQAVLGSA